MFLKSRGFYAFRYQLRKWTNPLFVDRIEQIHRPFYGVAQDTSNPGLLMHRFKLGPYISGQKAVQNYE